MGRHLPVAQQAWKGRQVTSYGPLLTQERLHSIHQFTDYSPTSVMSASQAR